MIYEVRTYDVKPGTQPEVEKRFGEAYEARKKYSQLAAFWHTEIGPLNQVIHVWPYKDLEERARIRAAAVKDGAWPPKIAEFVLAQRAEIMVPFPFSPELKPGRMGPCFEMRTYTVPAGELPKVMKLWEQVLPERVKLSPLAAVWHAELGGLNRFTHIWAYPSLDSRSETRKKAVASGVWPPSAVAKKQGLEGYRLLAQENKIVMPAPFSPLQ